MAHRINYLGDRVYCGVCGADKPADLPLEDFRNQACTGDPKKVKAREPTAVLQPWVLGLRFMQQTVLLTAIRGPDGLPKYNPTKMLLRWYRRCVLLSAMDGAVLPDPYDTRGGSFTGPSLGPKEEDPSAFWETGMDALVGSYLRDVDSIPHHFQLHFLHAAEILGYKHPDERIAVWWQNVYFRLVGDMHLHPETEAEMDRRLGDNREQWLERADPATQA